MSLASRKAGQETKGGWEARDVEEGSIGLCYETHLQVTPFLVHSTRASGGSGLNGSPLSSSRFGYVGDDHVLKSREP